MSTENTDTFAPGRMADVPMPLIEKSILIRRTEQKLLSLFSEGKLFGTVHTCIGQEWTGVAVSEGLRQGDLIFSNHRCHGHFIARTDDVEGLIAEIMGKQTGVCKGWGGSQHICKDGVFSNGIQGGITPVAAGLAMSQRYRELPNITVAFIGDGTLGEGVVYETLNIASKWNLPLLIVLENNRYSQSTSQHETLAGDISARFEAFGLKCYESSTWNLPELLDTARQATEYVRKEVKPAFFKIDTYRLMAHSKGDDDRDAQEVQSYWDKDPIAIWEKDNPELAQSVWAKVDERLDRAVEAAMAAEYSIHDEEADVHVTSIKWSPAKIDSTERMSVILRNTFEKHMSEDERLILLGEDIRSPYGGAFKVTKGLSDKFPLRVLNTPISEAAIVGIGNGLALGGLKPVCEIMFGDFLALAFDQLLNHASKFEYMYGRQVKVPLVVRTPMGGKRGYGPTHSQSIEKFFLGMPQTQVLTLHTRIDPGLVYDRLMSNIDRPTLVIENKMLYSLRVGVDVADGFSLEYSDEIFPTTRIRPEAQPDVTVFCFGGTLPDAEQAIQNAFDQEEIVCELICPTCIYPLNPHPVLDSLKKTGRLVIVEEGISFAGLGAELIAQLQELAPGVLKSVVRVGPPACPIPSCGPLEKQVLPNPQNILTAIQEIISNG